jgi:TonB family protein
MKKLLFLFLTLVAFACVSAQDIIVTKEAKKIEAKITEVSKAEIRYKELDNLDGPTFILSTDNIVTIIYANGKVVIYNDEEVQKEKGAVAKANAMGSLFGNTRAEVEIEQPVNRGQGGNTWSLDGRGLKGKLPKPANTFNQEGKVVVQIRVNAAGDVIEAKCVEGTSISDRKTLQLALDAAKKAKFSSGDADQIGTITYLFKLN